MGTPAILLNRPLALGAGLCVPEYCFKVCFFLVQAVFGPGSVAGAALVGMPRAVTGDADLVAAGGAAADVGAWWRGGLIGHVAG